MPRAGGGGEGGGGGGGGGGGKSGVQIVPDKSGVQMGGREVSAGGQEGFQMYFSDVLGTDPQIEKVFGDELGRYKLVERLLAEV